jgi:ubiquitin carboxyl-terminal hydrolase L3
MCVANNSTLQNLKDDALNTNIDGIAHNIEENKALEQAYADVAQQGDTEAPSDPKEEVDYHYICFVRSHKNGHLYQLDGDRPRPIDLGEMNGISPDVLSEQCLDVIRGMIASEDGNVNFSLMALVKPIP